MCKYYALSYKELSSSIFDICGILIPVPHGYRGMILYEMFIKGSCDSKHLEQHNSINRSIGQPTASYLHHRVQPGNENLCTKLTYDNMDKYYNIILRENQFTAEYIIVPCYVCSFIKHTKLHVPKNKIAQSQDMLIFDFTKCFLRIYAYT